MKIEVVVTNVEEAILAEKYGADCVELIHSFAEGGLSPKLALSEQVCAAVKIPVYIMVRPHGKNFVYSHRQSNQMLYEIKNLSTYTKAKGIVFGALTAEGELDVALLEKVIDAKKHLTLTFHRAIDAMSDPLAGYKELLNYESVDRVLTSGGAETAVIGASVIKQMVAAGKDVKHAQVLAGSGITPDNAREIIKQTGVTQIHVGTGVRTDNILDAKKFKQLLVS